VTACSGALLGGCEGEKGYLHPVMGDSSDREDVDSPPSDREAWESALPLLVLLLVLLLVVLGLPIPIAVEDLKWDGGVGGGVRRVLPGVYFEGDLGGLVGVRGVHGELVVMVVLFRRGCV